MPPTASQLLPQHLQPEHEEQSEDRDLLSAALSMLPPAEHQRILTDLILTARRCDMTRDYTPQRHLIDSVFTTARLHSSAEYRAAIDEARDSDIAQVVEASDFLKRLRNKTR